MKHFAKTVLPAIATFTVTIAVLVGYPNSSVMLAEDTSHMFDESRSISVEIPRADQSL